MIVSSVSANPFALRGYQPAKKYMRNGEKCADK